MLTRKRFMKLLILLMTASLLLAACDRPAPSSNNNGAGQTNDNDNGYPADGSDQTGDPAEPTRDPSVAGEGEGDGDVSDVEVPAEADGGEEDGDGDASEAEVPAEADGGEEDGDGDASEAEAPAETDGGEEDGDGDASEAEVPAEADGGEEDGDGDASEAEVPAEADGEEGEEVSEAEVPAEATETSEPEAGGQPLPATHTVVAGENLYRIGLQYGISWVAIAQANGIKNPDRIFAGQVLDIPGGGQQGTGGQPDPMPTPEGINYVVKPGDTLYKIAKQFGISWVEIAEANGLVNPNVIYAGQMIKIPVDAPSPPAEVYHVVKPGETLFRISLQYGLPWLAIANANQIGPPYVIYAGQTLVIPGGGY